MCYNKGAHLNQTKTSAKTEVTAVWSGWVYFGQGVAAVCRKCVSGFIQQLVLVNFSKQTSFFFCTFLYCLVHCFVKMNSSLNGFEGLKSLCFPHCGEATVYMNTNCDL